ncbi:MAG: hypothetical protein JW850_03085 [Thermoflexales bacterium]|nr:hypothetical protein [Thermoflexales bacterium]
MAVFLALIVVLVVLIVGGVFSEPIAAWLRRRFNWSYEGDQFLILGLVILVAFTSGLVTMYVLLRP